MTFTKKCPACGCELSLDAKQCPSCGLSGQDQIFLSREAYETWVKTVLDPHIESMTPPQVFAGTGHAVILLGNGDLYALGNNKNGACGENAPEELSEPVRIARRVRHAAVSDNHTLYAAMDGEAVLLGNSDLTDRFDCPLRVRRVYARKDREAFALVDEAGELYFFGNNWNEEVPLTEQTLRELPEMTLRTLMEQGWEAVYEHYTTRKGRYTLYRESILDDKSRPVTYFAPDKAEPLMQVRREPWYYELLRMYGEENVTVEVGKIVRSGVEREEERMVGQIYKTDSIRRYTYRPKVVLRNRIIYQPVPYAPEPRQEGCFCGCWPVTKELWDSLAAADMPQDAVKVMVGRLYRSKTDGDVLAWLDKNGNFHFTNSLLEQQLPQLPDILDFSISPQGGDKAYLLLVTKRREVLLGDQNELMGRRSWDHLVRLEFRDGELASAPEAEETRT